MILIFIMIAGTLITSTWLCLLGLLVFGLTALNLGWVSALVIILILNLLLLTAIGLVIFKLKENLLFSATRRQLSQISETKTVTRYVGDTQ